MRMINRMLYAALLQVGSLYAADHSMAQSLSPAEQRGIVFIQTNALDVTLSGRSDRARFRSRRHSERYTPSIRWNRLEESLAEGIVTGHPTMPAFRLDPGQIRDVIAYLKTLER